MSEFRKVLVVDNGERATDCALSAELAEMGFASVTTSLEATDDVLALIPSPAAILLHVPSAARWAERQRFLELAERLRVRQHSTGIPVIMLGDADGSRAASVLQSALEARVFSKPEL